MNPATTSPQQVVRKQLVDNASGALLPLWLGVVGIVIVVRIVIAYFNEFDTSVWTSMNPTTKVFLGIVGVVIPTVIMPWYISNGITRRHFNIGIMSMIVAVVAICGLVLMVGFAVEQAVYSAAGIGDALDNIDVYRSLSRASMVFASFTLAWAAWFTSGWLAGAGYYRFGGFGGTLLLPVALAPIALAEYLVGIDWGWNPSDISGPVRVFMSIPGWATGDVEVPFVAGALVTAAFIAAAMWLSHRLLRAAPIK